MLKVLLLKSRHSIVPLTIGKYGLFVSGSIILYGIGCTYVKKKLDTFLLILSFHKLDTLTPALIYNKFIITKHASVRPWLATLSSLALIEAGIFNKDCYHSFIHLFGAR